MCGLAKLSRMSPGSFVSGGSHYRINIIFPFDDVLVFDSSLKNLSQTVNSRRFRH